MGFFGGLLSTDSFMPHGHCYLWRPGVLWLEVISNALIGLAYVAISTTLVYLVRRMRDIPFQWMYVAFGLFIVACGFTHFMDIVTIWTPVYWADGFVRAVTAIASVGTALLLPSLVPKAVSLSKGVKFALDRGIKLETAYQELEKVFARTRELDELKTQFFANVSHELRTPLALILGPAEKLLAADGLTPGQRRDLEIVHRNGKSLLKHVNDLLDVAKLEAGKMAPSYRETDLSELVRLTSGNFDGFARERGIPFAVVVPEKTFAQVDAEMVRRVLMNLLSNAFKFSPTGRPISVSLAETGESVVIRVQDAGPGIPADRKELVFERFRQLDGGTTRQFGGTGLGLSIAKEFVDLHRGKIEVCDTVGGGATFTVTLPRRAPSDANVLPLRAARASAGPGLADEALEAARKDLHSNLVSNAAEKKGVVLVVEDHPEMNRFVSEALASEYHVLSAFDGAEGLEMAEKDPPDLILSDVMMPRMDGERFVAELRKRAGFDVVPVILLTAKADDDLRVRLLREGAQDYLTKPFQREELLARVRNLVTVKRATETLRRELASQIGDIEKLAAEVAIRREERDLAMRDLAIAKEEAEKASQVKSNFLGMISHEVKTPLASLQLYLEVLKRSGNLSPEQMKLVDRVTRSSEKSLAIMQSLLEYTRIQSGRFDPKPDAIDLRALLAPMTEDFRLQAHEKGLEFAVSGTEKNLPALRSDPLLVELVVKNLIMNAVKYTAKGSIRVAVDFADGEHRVSVEDTGKGIPAEDQARIFEPFHQATQLSKRPASGVGLGLAIAKEVVAALGGRIELVSEVGKGSRFTAVFASMNRALGAEENPVA